MLNVKPSLQHLYKSDIDSAVLLSTMVGDVKIIIPPALVNVQYLCAQIDNMLPGMLYVDSR